MLICAAAACTSAYRALSLRYEQPPVREDERVESLIDGNLALYGSRHKLSKREQEVLRLILPGTDNQNIASTMGVAPSTAKVHVHNILHKASNLEHATGPRKKEGRKHSSSQASRPKPHPALTCDSKALLPWIKQEGF